MSPLADFGRALAQLDDPRFLRVLLKGVGVTLAGAAMLGIGLVWLVGWIVPDTVSLPWIGEVGFLGAAAGWATAGAAILLSAFLMVPVAALVVGFFLDDIAAAVEARHYPALPPVRGLPVAAQLADGLRFLGVVAAANLLALVAYIALPPLAPFVFWAVNGYLLGREYFGLVAMRRLGPEGARDLRLRHRGRVWLAGTAMAVPLTLPLVNLIVPVLGVAVFTHQFHRLAPQRPGGTDRPA